MRRLEGAIYFGMVAVLTVVLTTGLIFGCASILKSIGL